MFEIQSLSYVTTNGARILGPISHLFEEGMIHGVIGQSGAGKTTLLRCLTGLNKTYLGKIRCFGKDKDFQKDIGFVAQGYSLLQRKNILDNVLLPVDLFKEDRKHYLLKAKELLDYVGLLSKQDYYPRQLSGGQKQRVTIARALILNPSVLLCDELTSALDQRTAKDILNLIKGVNKTTLIVTHDLNVIKACAKRICVLDQGQIIEEGETIEIFKTPKHPTTQQMVDHHYHTVLPEHWRQRIHKNYEQGDEVLYRLDFIDSNATGPVIAWAISHFGVSLNIVSGDLDYIQNEPLGHLVVSLVSPLPIDLQKAFKERGVRVHLLGYLRWHS